jgi:hypothetical protein
LNVLNGEKLGDREVTEDEGGEGLAEEDADDDEMDGE